MQVRRLEIVEENRTEWQSSLFLESGIRLETKPSVEWCKYCNPHCIIILICIIIKQHKDCTQCAKQKMISNHKQTKVSNIN
jgi:hypothetical protein